MKISIDLKFLTTAAATFILIVSAVIILNALAGIAPASAGAAVLGAIAIKLFDKLDYAPSFDIEFGAPKVSAPWIYSALAAVFIVYGCTLGGDIALSLFKRLAPSGYSCKLWPIVGISILDWGGFLVAGWLIGRLFRERALTFSSIAAFVVVAAFLLQGKETDKLERLARCLLGPELDPGLLASAVSGMATGHIFGVVLRGYAAIFAARLASRRPDRAPASNDI